LIVRNTLGAMVLKRMTRAKWTTLAKAVKTRMDDHNLTLLAAGVAFYAFLALIPALVAVVSLYGLVANPADVTRQVNDLAGALPHEARAFITSQLRSIIASSNAGVTVALAVGIVAALWSASAAMVSLVRGIDLAQGRRERRKLVAQRGLALALTAAAAALVIIVVLLVASAPALLANAGVGDVGRWVLNVARWPLVAVIMVLSLAALYHVVGGSRVGCRGRGRGLAPRVGTVRPLHRQLQQLQQDVRDAGIDRGGAALALARRPRGTHRGRSRRASGYLRGSWAFEEVAATLGLAVSEIASRARRCFSNSRVG